MGKMFLGISESTCSILFYNDAKVLDIDICR